MKKVIPFQWFAACVFAFMFAAGALYAGTAPSLELLSPRRGEEVPFGTAPVIAVSIFDADGDTDASTVKLEFDDEDFTVPSNISSFLVTFTVPSGIPAGRHTISFSVKDREGNEASLESYFIITAAPEKERKASANGTVRTGVEYDKEAPESVVGVLEVDVFGRLGERVDYSAIMDLTNEEQSDGQRVSTYRLDIRAPFITAVLGDTTPYFNTYSINGAEVFGVHLLPQFGFFGMELLYGESYRAVESPETYKQTVYGAKVKLGDPRSFQWGLGLLKVKDDADSIDTDASSPTPKDNLVLGTDLTFSAFKDVFSFYVEANESWLTADTTGGATDVPDAPSWINPSNLDWLFVFNESTSPLVPGLANLAAKAALKVGPIADNTFGAEYSYVGASYASLANPTLLTDRTGIRAWDALWLLQRKLYFNLGFQYYTDNLQDTKTDTLKTMGFTGSMYVYPTDYLILGAGADVQTADNGAMVDTVNTSINGSANYRYGRPWADLNMYATLTTAIFHDNYTPANDLNKYSPRIGTIAYFTGIPLDSKAEAGVDVGDVPTSVYVEGRAGYRFLRDETLYAFTGLVYETGPELLDWELGANYTAPFDITFEADFEYITLPGSPGEVILSAYATKRF